MKRKKLMATYLTAAMVILSGCSQGVKEITIKGADGKEYTSYRTACSNGDFDAAREYIEKMKGQLTDAKAKDNSELETALRETIEEAEKYVENEELQYLASLNEEKANNRIILILHQSPVEGLEAAENVCLAKDVDNFYLNRPYFEHNVPDAIQNFKRYITWCANHNSKCNSILNIAIACGNQSLAKKILYSFRSDPELLLKKNESKKNDHVDVYSHYTNGSKDAAQKKYDEAVKSGAFDK